MVNGAPPAAIPRTGRAHHVGPTGWQREQTPVLVVQVDPVLAPVLPVDDELEILAAQRDGTGASPGRVGTDHAHQA